MTYARARLWLGISGVGFWVTLAATLLLTQTTPFSDSLAPATSLAADVKELSLLLGLYVLFSAPFDWLGGYEAPRRFARPVPALPDFIGQWLRGVLGQSLVLLVAGLTLLMAGRAGGRWGAIVAALVIMSVLLAAQGWLARCLGGLRTAEANWKPDEQWLACWGVQAPAATVLDVTDPAFVGGFVGWPGRERLILPASWLQQKAGLPALTDEAVATQIARRIGVIERGSRRRGVLLALFWNVTGFALATTLPGAGATTSGELLMTACGFTLWSFLGLLTLPSFSRPGVFEGDYFAAQHGIPLAALERTAAALDQWQDDEPARSAFVETIFHPIPSVHSRLRQLAAHGHEPRGAWQAARMALFLSWGCLGLLSRAVHCNSGRPELWVMFPGD
ncbi:MAG: hypothetical protein ACKV2V_08175 [Blastocatellia bacterium]